VSGGKEGRGNGKLVDSEQWKGRKRKCFFLLIRAVVGIATGLGLGWTTEGSEFESW
jgi:hypothetical protein